MENNQLYIKAMREIAEKETSLVLDSIETWSNFSKTVFKEGVLPEKTKRLIAVAVAHVTQCPYCIRDHTAQAFKKGANKEEIMEAICVAAELHACAAFAHAPSVIDEMENFK